MFTSPTVHIRNIGFSIEVIINSINLKINFIHTKIELNSFDNFILLLNHLQ